MITPFNLNERKKGFTQKVGKVYLVGAGPGDPELLTMKAYRLISQAEVIFCDSLVSDEIINLVSPKTKLIFVGKRANRHSASQSEINQYLVDYAKQGLNVVRLLMKLNPQFMFFPS